MRIEGLTEKEVLAKLAKIGQKDLNYQDGKILCSLCSKPLAVSAKAQRLFYCSNLGDPGLFPGSEQLEHEAVKKLTDLLNAPEGVGFIVSGGTEANLIAMLIARNKAKIANPEIILPESAHFSFIKICNLLRLKPVWTNLDESFRADSESVQEKINKNTVAIVGTAGTAELGAIDPINRLSATAEMNGIFFHVDAAFGGLIIPFMKDIGFKVPEFDFTLKGVNSMTVDPHKMGLTPICAGGILFRDNTLLDFAKTDTPYLTQEAQYTFVGSRSGASAAATWASLEFMGRNGFRKVVKRCIGLTESLSFDLESSGFNLVTKPSLNIVAFRAFNARLLTSKLRERGWWVSYVPRYDCIRIVIMPHTKKSHLTAFMNVLHEVAQSSDTAFKGFS